MARGLGSLFKFFRRGTKKIDEPTPQSVDEAVVVGKQDPSVPIKTPAVVAKPPVKLEPLQNKYTGPLQMGDATTRPQFGSQTYDWITAKGPGKFTSDEWIDHLLDVKKKEIRGPFGGTYKETIINPRQFEYGKNYNGMNLFNETFPGNNRGRVHLEELFDSGIAGFDKKGNLTSGILFAAKQANLRLTADDLTSLIKNSPVNRLQTVIYQSSPQPKAAKAIQDISADFGNKTINLKTTLTPDVREGAEASIRQAKRRMNELFRNDTMRAGEFKETMEFARDDLLYLRDKVTPASSARINQTIGKLDEEIKAMKDFRRVENQFQENYTLAGGDNYREMVVKMPGPIERNLEPLKTYGHYSKEANPVYFSRFDTRYTQDGKKVLFIHDVQSDANQSLAKQIRRLGQTGLEGTVESTRRNPYAEEVAFGYLANAKKQLLDKLVKMDPTDLGAQRGIAAQIKQIDKATRFKKQSYSEKMDRNYMPFLDSSQYGNHALRMHMKRAADEGYDYVAIAPYEKVAIRMHSGPKPGNERFYGSAYGKGIEGKGEGLMPKLMKQNAKFHGSNAGTIKVAYSDPKKPYKVITEKRMSGAGAKPDFETKRTKAFFEHKEAYAREADAPGNAVYVAPEDPSLYFDAFAIKVTPSMRGPVQSYSTGGLAVDIFKTL
jgi:hypothetical protein